MSLFDLVSLGVVYIIRRERSRDEIARDLQLIGQHGFSSVTIWPVVSWWDRPDRPERSFDTTLSVLDECERNGLKVIAECIGQNPGSEMIPDYRMKKEYYINLTDGRMSHWTSHNWQNPINYNHPEVREIIAETMRACAVALRDHPSLLAWDVFNETNFTSYDPVTLELYRAWLESKYDSIAKLNAAWERSFRDFTDISFIPATEGYHRWGSLVPVLDEDEFRSQNLATIVAEWTRVLNEADPEHPVIADNALSTSVWEYRKRGTDDFRIARAANIYGTTYYPFGSFYSIARDEDTKHEDLYMATAVLTGARSAAPEDVFLVSELQTHGQSMMRPNTGIGPEEVRLLAWQALASGARSITFWKWRPFIRGGQTSARGLTRYDGTPSPRAEAAAGVATALKRYPEILATMRAPKARAAMLLDPACHVYSQALVRSENASYVTHELLGWQRLLTREGIETAYLHSQFLQDVDLADYPLIILPAQFVVEEDVAQRLAQYTAAGGTLIATSRLAMMNRQNYLYPTIPGAGLADVFGVQELDIAPAGDPVSLADLGEMPGGGPFLQALEVSPAAEVVDRFGCTSAETGGTVSVDGMPAIVRASQGKGTAWYVGFDIGFGVHHAPADSDLKRPMALLRSMLPEACYDPVQILKRDGPCEVHCLPCAEGHVVIALNHTRVGQRVDVRLGESIRDGSISPLDVGTDVEFTARGDGEEVGFDLPPLGVGVAHVC